MSAGETVKIRVSFVPENASDKTLRWRSSNQSVATVSDDGTVTAVGEGTATITVTPTSGSPKTCVVTVTVVRPDSLTLSELPETIVEGDTFDLTYTFTPAEAYTEGVEWTSSDETVATVDETGKVTTLAAGTATITLTLKDGSENPKTASAEVVVDPYIHAESVTLDQTLLELEAGDTVQLIATVLPEDAMNKNVTWTSDAESFATVDENGLVTAITPGTAVITVTTEDGGYTATCEVLIETPVVPETITLDVTEAELDIGDELQLTATVLPEDAVNKTVIWKTSDETVCTVDDTGKVTAVFEGMVTITASTEENDLKAFCVIKVREPVRPTSVTFDNTELTVAAGYTAQITATVLPEDSVNKTLVWTSDEQSVATVDENGLVTAIAPGVATIRAQALAGTDEVFAECIVTVEEPVPVTGITLSEEEITLSVGERKRLPEATVTPEDATDNTLTWTVSEESENPNAIIILDTGFIEAIEEGVVVVVVSDVSGTVTATFKVIVTA